MPEPMTLRSFETLTYRDFSNGAVLDEIAEALAERERLLKERKAIQSQSCVLTCVYCGQAYPPGTPASNHDALTEHIKQCPRHPLAAALRENRELRRECDLLAAKLELLDPATESNG